MKRILFLVTALLMTISGAWATVTLPKLTTDPSNPVLYQIQSFRSEGLVKYEGDDIALAQSLDFSDANTKFYFVPVNGKDYTEGVKIVSSVGGTQLVEMTGFAAEGTTWYLTESTQKVGAFNISKASDASGSTCWDCNNNGEMTAAYWYANTEGSTWLILGADDAPQFETSTLASPKWYYIQSGRADRWLYADGESAGTTTDNSRTDSYKFAFISANNGVYIVSKAGLDKGSNQYLTTAPGLSSEASTFYYCNAATTEDYFFLADTPLRFNSSYLGYFDGVSHFLHIANDGNLTKWYGHTDTGNFFRVIDSEISDKSALAEAISEAQALVDGASVPGYPSSSAASTLDGVLTSAKAVYANTAGDYAGAYNTLAAAISTAKSNIGYTPRTDVYYTITSARGSMVYDPSHDSNADADGNNFLWYTASLDNTDANHLWGFIERDGNYYMYNVGRKQFATVSTTGTYQYYDKGTWVFSNTPAFVTFDAGIENSVAAPYVRVRATVATTATTYSMSISTGYVGPVITYDAKGDGGIPMMLATSSVAVDAEVTAAIEALLNDLTPFYEALNAQIAAAEAKSIGSGLGQYVTTEAFTSALAAAKATYANTYATKDELQQATSNLEAAIAALTYNLPNGKFVRLKNTSVEGYSYAGTAASGKAPLVASATDAGIYYVTDDSKIISYNQGKYLTTNAGAQCGLDGATITFGDGGNGTYTLYYGGAGYLIAWTSGSTDRLSSVSDYALWTFEEVTELPVTITAAEVGTLYSPVALTIPTGVNAYVGELDGSTINLTQVSGTIPANTGVYLEAEEGTYNFTIAANAESVESCFTGTVPAILNPATASSTVYALGNGSKGYAFYKWTMNLNGFKAFLTVDAASPSNEYTFKFVDDDLTGITKALNGQSSIGNGQSVYDLTGRKVADPQKGQIYIVNGKKMIY